MSCYNQCKECGNNEYGFCVFKNLEVNYHWDTSECKGVEEIKNHSGKKNMKTFEELFESERMDSNKTCQLCYDEILKKELEAPMLSVEEMAEIMRNETETEHSWEYFKKLAQAIHKAQVAKRGKTWKS